MVELENIITVDLIMDSLESAIEETNSNPLFSEIGEMLYELQDKISESVEDGLNKAAEDNADLMKMFITINRSIITGGLIESIQVEEESEFSFRIAPEADYAEFVEDGRGDVYPVSARCLHWVSYGEEIFRMHSGPADPRPFVEPAFERTDGGRAVQFIEEALSNVL